MLATRSHGPETPGEATTSPSTPPRVRKRPTKAADRRQARRQIDADMEELADLYEGES